MAANTGTEERALKLLGSGLAPSIVASALGVSESRISQLLSDDSFAQKVVELRYSNLQKHTALDDRYDTLEDKLLKKLEDLLPLMHRPMEVLRSIQIVNAAKRRGAASNGDTLQTQSQVISLNIPVVVINKFQANQVNQVVQVGDTSLVTMQPGTLLKEVNNAPNIPRIASD